MQALKKLYISEAEYAEGEKISPIKHEWFDGEVFAMAGGTPEHSTITVNLAGVLSAQLRGRDYKIYNGQLRVKIAATGLLTYPDLSVVCSPARFDTNDPDSLLNPSVLIEVLSPSTENYDRTVKFDHFKQIESLTDYLLISTDCVRVEHYTRAENGSWNLQTFTLRSETVTLESADVELPLDEIYERLELPEGLQTRSLSDVPWSAS